MDKANFQMNEIFKITSRFRPITGKFELNNCPSYFIVKAVLKAKKYVTKLTGASESQEM
jgi:hypothetical protein